MKKNLIFLFVGLMTVMGFGLASCSGNSADEKVKTFVDQLNSDKFKEQTLKSGVFTGAETKVEDDAIVLTFTTIPGLTFKNAPQAIMDAQKESMLKQFKPAVSVDKVFREGFEGMKEKNLIFRIKFLDTKGDSASLDIAPSEVLE